MASSCAVGGTSPTTLAVVRKLRSGCTSATASFTGPSPNTCSTSAPLNLMLDCISAPAAAIWPSSERTGGGNAPTVSRRCSASRQLSVSRTSTPRTGAPSKRNLWSSLTGVTWGRVVSIQPIFFRPAAKRRAFCA